MFRMVTKCKGLYLFMAFWFCLISQILNAKTATSNQAKQIAQNWIRFVVDRDGHWGKSKNPVIKKMTEFKWRELLLGYFADVDPQGYILVSSLKDFAPIKAYSTVSNLDPDNEIGMCALLKDDLVSRNLFLIEAFGGLDETSLKNLHIHTPDSYRRAWEILSRKSGVTAASFQIMGIQAAGPVGPLLKSKWGQGPPFNDQCPDMNCTGTEKKYNSNAVVGCVPLAMAQIMRFFCWPPFFGSEYYDWPNTLVNEAYYDSVNNKFLDGHFNDWTQAQIDAVADLCADAGSVLDITYGCSSTGAPMCAYGRDDARDAFENHFYYDTENDEPDCEYRDEHSNEEWWNIIKSEINQNKPMVYHIENTDDDREFRHAIVVDGYDDSGGQYKVHVNYGWSGDWHNNWYELDWFDCDSHYGWSLRCDWEEEFMIRDIKPRNGICEWFSGTLGPWGGAGTLHHYIYCDTYSNNLTIQSGARLQFLPGISLICNGNEINIAGKSPDETRFFTEGLPTRGIKIASQGEMKLLPDGGITIY